MMKIAICAGHHAEAKGAVNAKYKLNEHDEACKVIMPLAEILAERGFSVHVFKGQLSRKISEVNNANVDLAIDLHFNAGGGKGCEVVHVPNSPARRAQADVMASHIASCMGLRNRGGKEGWWWGGALDDEGNPTKPDAFVTQTNCPAFIPEPLFIDNDKEVGYWLDSGRHDQIALAIAEAIEAAGWRA